MTVPHKSKCANTLNTSTSNAKVAFPMQDSTCGNTEASKGDKYVSRYSFELKPI